MKSKIRLLTILFSLVMLLAFGTVPYLLFIKKGVDSINIATIAATVIFLLLLAGLFAIIWLTLIVKLDKESRTITFTYPFTLSSTSIHFDDIIGFRYRYLSGRIEYKALQVKTNTGQTFTFSDFETENLRDFEKEFIDLFEIRKGKNFYKLSQEQKDFEIENSRTFDFEQAKEIRFMLYVIIAFCVFVLASFVKKFIDDEIKNSVVTIIAATMTILILAINKLKRTNRQIKNGA